MYVGQSTNKKKLSQQHAHCPPNKMKDDVLKFKPFHMHFGLQIEYTATRKYLVNRKEKQCIKKLKVNTKLTHNVLKGSNLFESMKIIIIIYIILYVSLTSFCSLLQ